MTTKNKFLKLSQSKLIYTDIVNKSSVKPEIQNQALFTNTIRLSNRQVQNRNCKISVIFL